MTQSPTCNGPTPRWDLAVTIESSDSQSSLRRYLYGDMGLYPGTDQTGTIRHSVPDQSTPPHTELCALEARVHHAMIHAGVIGRVTQISAERTFSWDSLNEHPRGFQGELGPNPIAVTS